jgi:uracil-DNA glycosylase
MPSASWVPIVSILVSAMTTLAAPIIALFVAARMNRPKPRQAQTCKKPNPENWRLAAPRFSITLGISAFWYFAQPLHSPL